MKTDFFKMKIPIILIMLLPMGLGGIPLKAQNAINIRGTVSDSSGEPLVGVNIVVKGTNNGVVSDVDGNYQINVSDSNVTLVFSYIGYTQTEVAAANRIVINVVLEEDSKLIDEVVVIGYGTVARKDVTTAVSIVSLKDMEERPIVSAAQAIQGKAAGVNVYQPNGSPGGEMVIRVRGTTSFNGSRPSVRGRRSAC
jgi:hypothetical protein